MRIRVHLNTGEIIEGRDVPPEEQTLDNSQELQKFIQDVLRHKTGCFYLNTDHDSWACVPVHAISYVEIVGVSAVW